VWYAYGYLCESRGQESIFGLRFNSLSKFISVDIPNLRTKVNDRATCSGFKRCKLAFMSPSIDPVIKAPFWISIAMDRILD
jgi:hypothetical protein